MPTVGCRVALLVLWAGAAVGFGSSVTAQTAEGATVEVSSTVVERGEDFAVHQRVVTWTDASGAVRFQTNRFTLLENALHYFEDGQWKESEDVIEAFPGGAIARRGPNKAIFSPDLNAEAVFDIATSDEKRVRGGVRQIQLTDVITGKSILLATVKASAPGELVPPNQVVYRDALEGLKADVALVWQHHQFSHSIILRERVELPPNLAPASLRLEIVTELVAAPAPWLRQRVLKVEGQPDLVEDVLIDFGRVTIICGKAFAAAGTAAVTLGAFSPTGEGIPVIKQWKALEDGRTFLVESVAWRDIEPLLQDLPVAERADNSRSLPEQVAAARRWPVRPAASAERKPIQVARLPYQPTGLVLDFETLNGSTSSKTFEPTQTYYIPASYIVGPGTATFKPGCVIKYNSNASLLVFGATSFPSTQQTPVFTAWNDDGFGEDIDGTPGSTPTQCAKPAVWFYYIDYKANVQNARFRWAQCGVEFIANPGQGELHTVRDSLFENSSIGIYLDTSSSVNLVNVTKHNVTTPVSGTSYGSMTEAKFYTDKSFKGLDELFTSNPVPDTMGAVGLSHFVELVNGRIAVFDKSTGQLLENARTYYLQDPAQGFFTVQHKGVTYPTGQVTDGRILYDHFQGRWVACALDTGSGQVIVAVSNTSSPLGLLSSWTKHVLEVKDVTASSDFPTLGMDANGVYLSVVHFHMEGNILVNDGHTIVPLRKTRLYVGGPLYDGQGEPLYDPQFVPPPADPENPGPEELLTWSIQPALNFDDPPSGGHVWFIAKGAPAGQGSLYQPGPIRYRRLQWVGQTDSVTWADTSWQTLSAPPARRYFDLECVYYDPNCGAPDAPQLGGPIKLSLKRVGSRLMSAVVRTQGSTAFLWTCQFVGLDGTDGDYDGNETGGDMNRSGIHWWKLQINSTGTPLTYNTSTMVYDNAASNPYWYFMPSLMVNQVGDMALGFSASRGTVSSGTEYIGALYTGRLSGGTTPSKPILLQAGSHYRPDVLWGDYSATVLDPSDSLSFWTVQEYVEDFSGSQFWGTWVGKITPVP
ncbi:MAG: hypothetical protein HYY24_23015 [Verrucomicrobia bacterium]|nr:hypothetical protein [Verrucomicrobiota bacterium]